MSDNDEPNGLETMSAVDLREMCKNLDLSTSGTKRKLIERITETLKEEWEWTDSDSNRDGDDEPEASDTDDHDRLHDDQQQPTIPIGDLPIGKKMSMADCDKLARFCKSSGIRTKQGFINWLDSLKSLKADMKMAILASTNVSAVGMVTLAKAVGDSPDRKDNSIGTSLRFGESDKDDSDDDSFHFASHGAATGDRHDDAASDAHPHLDGQPTRPGAPDGLFFDGYTLKSSSSDTTHNLPDEFDVNTAVFQHRPGKEVASRFRETLAPVAALFTKTDPPIKQHFTRPEITGRIEVLYLAQKKLEKLCYEDIFIHKKRSAKLLENPLPAKVWKELKAIDSASGFGRAASSFFGNNNDGRNKRCHRCGMIGHLKANCISTGRRAAMWDTSRSNSFQQSRPRARDSPNQQ